MLMNSTSVQAAPELTIGHYELVSSKRITRTVFEYTYKADVTNTGTDALDVSATLSVTAPGVTVLDGKLSFGDVAAGARVTSSDTFAIRQDRQYSFAVDALQWEIKSDANPTVQWTPSSLYASLAAGESTTTIASFVPTANATNVSVEVLPELAPYVSVSPTSFASVGEGASYPVTVTMTAPVEMVVGAYDGSIQLRQGTRTLTESLAVVMEVVWPTFDGGEELGLSIEYPPGWYVESHKGRLWIRNVSVPSAVPEEMVQEEAFFEVQRHADSNPRALTIDEWFDVMRPFSADNLISETPLVIDGYDAIQIVVTGIGQNRAHIFVAQDTDIIEINYGLGAPHFEARYLDMLSSFNLSP
jgi:hypothetical protein